MGGSEEEDQPIYIIGYINFSHQYLLRGCTVGSACQFTCDQHYLFMGCVSRGCMGGSVEESRPYML